MTVKVTISICTPQSGYPLLSLRLSSFLQKLEVNRQAVASVSLRLGHARALTPHCGVIHSPRAASLPTKGKPYKGSSPPWRLVRSVRLPTAAASHRPTNVEYCSTCCREVWFVPFVCHGTTEDVVPYKSWGRSCAAVALGSCRLFTNGGSKPPPYERRILFGIPP